jgi:pimeloyl-ACP methyl ester carboxylesterase
MFKRLFLFGLAATASPASVAQPSSQSAAPSSQTSMPEPSVTMPREVLGRYVGRYAQSGTLAIVSLTDDGRLSVELAGQPKGPPLRTVSANEFAADAVGVRIFFEGDGPKASRFRSQYQGSEVTFTRIADGAAWAPPVDEKLVPYANAADLVALPDGRKLHIVCMGKGSPTVILTAGGGDFSGNAWSNVQPEMARITRTCAWDRPGFGLSDGTGAEVTAASMTADLEAALATGGIAGPYVMVGHSIGSLESLLFTDRHPDKVVGMVLVDPTLPGGANIAAVGPGPNADKAQVEKLYRSCFADVQPVIATAAGSAPSPCGRLFSPTWPLALRQAVREKAANPLQFEAMFSSSVNTRVSTQQALNPSRNYRDMPLIVLPPGMTLTDEQKAQLAVAEAEGIRGHAALAALSTRGRNTRVPGANHYIQLTKPQAVLDAVAEVVGEARSSRR